MRAQSPRLSAADNGRSTPVAVWFLLISLLAALVIAPGAQATGGHGNHHGDRDRAPFRTIVTADLNSPSNDDMRSVHRLLLYANQLGDGLEGLIYSSSFLRFTNDPPTQPWNTDLFQSVIRNGYAQAYNNLRKHDRRYPSPQHLLSLVKIGNITAADEYQKDTEGSLLIKDVLLDRDPRPVYLQAWGGTNTIAAALRSIEDDYKGTRKWPSIKRWVSDKARINIILDQDRTYKAYIAPNWPEIDTILNRDQFFVFAYTRARLGNWPTPRLPIELEPPFSPSFMQPLATGPLLSSYELSVGDPIAPDGSFAGEGDSPAFFELIDNGLRSLEDPTYGGWGGRFTKVGPHLWSDWPTYAHQPAWIRPNNACGCLDGWNDPTRVRDDSPFDPAYEMHYPQSRWISALQNDFAARATWQTKSYRDANHAPSARVDEDLLDIRVKRGERVKLDAKASDPDGDRLSARWWQYREAGTYAGSVTVDRPTALHGRSASFVVPRDAKRGDTIHVILEVTDSGTPALTSYQRVIATVK